AGAPLGHRDRLGRPVDAEDRAGRPDADLVGEVAEEAGLVDEAVWSESSRSAMRSSQASGGSARQSWA
ncbi:MAG: hypothetical protein ACJ77H_01590, partial [Actinomycetota bacterium]